MKKLFLDIRNHVILDPIRVTGFGILFAFWGTIKLAWRLFWHMIMGLCLIGWVGYTFMALIVALGGHFSAVHMIGMWLYFGAWFLGAFMLKRAGEYPFQLFANRFSSQQPAADVPFIEV